MPNQSLPIAIVKIKLRAYFVTYCSSQLIGEAEHVNTHALKEGLLCLMDLI